MPADGFGAAAPRPIFEPERGFVRLRGKDSNLDYLIQSQASYH